jgi:hypothetical protein
MNVPHQSPPVVREETQCRTQDNKDAGDPRRVNPQGECDCLSTTNTWWCWYGKNYINTHITCP